MGGTPYNLFRLWCPYAIFGLLHDIEVLCRRRRRLHLLGYDNIFKGYELVSVGESEDDTNIAYDMAENTAGPETWPTISR